MVFDVSSREQAPIKVGVTLSSKTVASLLGLAPRRLSKITMTTDTPKNCKVTSAGVTATKAGACSLLVTVKDPSTGATSTRYARTFITVKK